MTLLQLLESKTEAERLAFAKSCGSRSVLYLFHVARGHKRAGESMAINIERESGGKVTCEELRPDVDWAYLRNTKPKKNKAA
jgi:DNA-binding transcriptional regulator YdaS (Cro superfamily)